MKQLLTALTLNLLVALTLQAQGGLDSTCVRDCDGKKQRCADTAAGVYITCGQQGGDQATCQAKKEKAYQDCIAATGCDVCYTCGDWRAGTLGQAYYCRCGNPYICDDTSCQTDYSGNCPDCDLDDGLAWQNCTNMESQWQTAPTCDCVDPSPVVIDVNGDGLKFTNRQNGALFDLNGDARANQIPWVVAGSDDAWLALDRNGDGLISTGSELFGTYTEQAETDPKKRNGFLALAEFDKKLKGGNGDGRLDQEDKVFPKLVLWQDVNHDGVSQTIEQHDLASLGVHGLDLSVKEWKKVDEYGNEFRYRVRIFSDKGIDNWAYDVFFPTAQKR